MRILLALALTPAISTNHSLAFSSVPITDSAAQVSFDANANVERFYGVPMNLTVSSLRRLRLPMKIRYERGEDDPYPVYTIAAEDGVEVEVTFDTDGKLYLAHTASPNAVGPKKLGVGSRLSDVKAAWPSGKLLYGCEDGFFVTFVTGTNVMYEFDPQEMPRQALQCTRLQDSEIPNIRVRRIRISSSPNPVP